MITFVRQLFLLIQETEGCRFLSELTFARLNQAIGNSYNCMILIFYVLRTGYRSLCLMGIVLYCTVLSLKNILNFFYLY